MSELTGLESSFSQISCADSLAFSEPGEVVAEDVEPRLLFLREMRERSLHTTPLPANEREEDLFKSPVDISSVPKRTTGGDHLRSLASGTFNPGTLLFSASSNAMICSSMSSVLLPDPVVTREVVQQDTARNDLGPGCSAGNGAVLGGAPQIQSIPLPIESYAPSYNTPMYLQGAPTQLVYYEPPQDALSDWPTRPPLSRVPDAIYASSMRMPLQRRHVITSSNSLQLPQENQLFGVSPKRPARASVACPSIKRTRLLKKGPLTLNGRRVTAAMAMPTITRPFSTRITQSVPLPLPSFDVASHAPALSIEDCELVAALETFFLGSGPWTRDSIDTGRASSSLQDPFNSTHASEGFSSSHGVGVLDATTQRPFADLMLDNVPVAGGLMSPMALAVKRPRFEPLVEDDTRDKEDDWRSKKARRRLV
ncbi:hypothetical protein BDV98DRAFT_571770 [Pterulicium gracile]|uniref:Uncharacterized protein n=1 Tax=Pterulicium gracile TaxID=1884261 RepID=A0A5C3QF93_9AGAR|nr:hypothetical protein BDV98DRAFT_571770 [Pterula gracilis]